MISKVNDVNYDVKSKWRNLWYKEKMSNWLNEQIYLNTDFLTQTAFGLWQKDNLFLH